MNNLPVDVAVFSLCCKETLFQAKFQHYKWKSWSSFLTDKLCLYIFGGWGVFSMGEILSSGFLSGVYVWGLYVLEPLQDSFSTQLCNLLCKYDRFLCPSH